MDPLREAILNPLFTPEEQRRLSEFANRHFAMMMPKSIRVPSDKVPSFLFPRMTWIQRMYARWEGNTQREAFYNVALGESYMLSRYRDPADLYVPAEYASEGVLTEPKVVFEFEIKEPTRVPDIGTCMFGYIPQPPSEPEIVCPCCKGSGIYTGFIKVEPCGECKGTGKVKGSPPAKPTDQPGAKGSPDIDYSALGLMMRQDREFG
jgi:hypothetical protein